MKLKIRTILYLTAAFAILSQSMIADVSAQQNKNKQAVKPKVVNLKATRGAVVRGGRDPNIKTDDAPNKQEEKARRPWIKSGAKQTRGGGDCKVIFGNYTDFRVKLYVNQTYRGTVASFNDAYLYLAPNRATIVYARADFADGTFLAWGPEEYECGANQFIYFKLTSGKD